MCHVTNRTRTNKHKLDRTRTQKLTMFCIYNYSPLFPIAFTPLLCSMFIIIIMYAVFQTVKVMPKKTGLVATVIRQDIIATNGYINIIDKVRLSLTTKLNNDHTIKRTLSKKQSLLKTISFRLLSFSAWSFGFFIPATTANDLQLRRIFYPRFYQVPFL